MGHLLGNVIVSVSWIYNIWCWIRGLWIASRSLQINPKDTPLQRIATGVDNLGKCWFHLTLTLADFAGVGLVRWLIGESVSSHIPSAILSVVISFMIQQHRKGKLEKWMKLDELDKDGKENTYKSQDVNLDDI
jgi:hypothetical protein